MTTRTPAAVDLVVATVRAFFVALLFLGPLAAQADELDLGERAACHRAVEAVYWAHRTWPDGNGGAKPSLDAVLPAAVLQRRAEDAVAMSRALDGLWARPVTGDMLRREVERMAAATRRPEMLAGLFAALQHDSRLVGECLARPVLAERLLRRRYEEDEGLHAGVERRARGKLAAVASAGQLADRADRYREVEWTTTEAEGEGRLSLDPAAWSETLSALAEKLGLPAVTAAEALPAGVVGPLQEDGERFYALGVISARPDAVRVGIAEWPKEPFATWWERERGAFLAATADATVDGFPLPRPASGQVCAEDTWQPLPYEPPALDGHRAVWTGAEMIVWGGTPAVVVGGRYDPAIDNWRPIAVEGEPQKRVSHTMVWTGTEMIVWGGWGFLTSENTLNSGARYNPTLDAWTPTSLTGAPVRRTLHAAVWTGSRMVVWGGCDTFGCANALATGGRYDPASDTWTPTSTAGAATPRSGHTAVWADTEMIVWSGCTAFGCGADPSGGRYDPASDTWRTLSTVGAPGGRSLHTAVWTGSQMIVWGGVQDFTRLDTGGRYTPATDTWSPTTTSGAPMARRYHVAAWAPTAARMFVWGGCPDHDCSSHLASGGLYDPVADAWTPTSTASAPSARSQATAVWTGTEVIVWGGCTSGECQIELNTGGRYDPVADAWTATGLPDDPGRRLNHTAVWTGAEMIVWGGFDQGLGVVLTGRRYDPATDTWSGMSFTGLVGARDGHTAVWTGIEMVVWGGRQAGLGTTITGGRYRPAPDTWQTTNLSGAPDPRAFHTAVWTGSRMVVWGGCAFDDCASYRDTGGRYDPATDTWSAMTTAGAPSARFLHPAVWTASRMVVWGGYDGVSNLGTGGRYDPVGDAWTPTSLAGAPAPRRLHTAVGTGAEMIVWGGRDQSAALRSGARYQPVADTWTPTPEAGAPAGRWDHVAVWTGDEMVVWGGCTNLDCSADRTGLTTTGGRYDAAGGGWVATSTLFAPHGRTNHTAVWTGEEMIVWGGWRGSSAEITNTGARYCAAGLVVPQPDITVAPGLLTFGAVLVGETAERTLTVLNVGNGALTVSQVVPPSPPFSIVADGCTGATMPPGGSCTIRVRFAPLAAGPFSGQLLILSNDPDEPQVSVPLSGNGVILSLQAAALALQDANGNQVWDPGETAAVATSWANTGSVDAPGITGTATASAGITLVDGTAAYGTIPAGATRSCVQGGDCYDATATGPRPATHWDAVLSETLSSGHPHDWTLHVGGSFGDAGPGHPFYRFVETVLHNGVTGGCTATGYCPERTTAREQMAVFVLVAKEGPGYAPPACQPGTELFVDVPATSPFCRWVEELARRGVVGGCGGGSYCPMSPVTREQMSVFLLKTLDPALDPPPCGTPAFGDVPATSPFCRWIEELARRGITGGCSTNPPLYCPTVSVSRGQMAVFCTTTFDLRLYGP